MSGTKPNPYARQSYDYKHDQQEVAANMAETLKANGLINDVPVVKKERKKKDHKVTKVALNLKLTPESKEQLSKYAAEKGMTVSMVVQMFIQKYCK